MKVECLSSKGRSKIFEIILSELEKLIKDEPYFYEILFKKYKLNIRLFDSKYTDQSF